MFTSPEGQQPTVKSSSFDEYYRYDFPKLVLYGMSQRVSRFEAEELVQDVMVSIADRWETIDTPLAYARRAVTNKVRAFRGKAAHAAAAEAAYMRGKHLAPAADLNDGVRELLQIVHNMPEDRREVMGWHIQGFTAEEIAAFTGRNPATVRSHLRHGRATIAQLLKLMGDVG
ncbi:RNA polymerase sigma factor [Nonomuraea sp. NPDC049714]|uniref:RNA polymerase sigma factor n=1 Tax=Nonomuraea sp. NPDC049714 TaxID=3364357 RepID=UPI0037AD588D